MVDSTLVRMRGCCKVQLLSRRCRREVAPVRLIDRLGRLVSIEVQAQSIDVAQGRAQFFEVETWIKL